MFMFEANFFFYWYGCPCYVEVSASWSPIPNFYIVIHKYTDCTLYMNIFSIYINLCKFTRYMYYVYCFDKSKMKTFTTNNLCIGIRNVMFVSLFYFMAAFRPYLNRFEKLSFAFTTVTYNLMLCVRVCLVLCYTIHFIRMLKGVGWVALF